MKKNLDRKSRVRLPLKDLESVIVVVFILRIFDLSVNELPEFNKQISTPQTVNSCFSFLT
jgi:hypothetical protein